MHINILERRDDPPTCRTGKLYYTCDFEDDGVPIKFSGCCSVDACHQLGVCPDDTIEPLSSSNTATTTPKTTPKTTPTPKSVSSPASTISTATTSRWSPPPQADATASTQPQTSSAAAKSPNIAVIAGAVVGGFVLLMCAGAIWYLLRNRASKKRVPPPPPPPEASPLSPAPAWESKRERDSAATHGHESMAKYGHQSMASSHWSERSRLSELPSTHMDPVELSAEPESGYDYQRSHQRSPSDGVRLPLMQGH